MKRIEAVIALGELMLNSAKESEIERVVAKISELEKKAYRSKVSNSLQRGDKVED